MCANRFSKTERITIGVGILLTTAHTIIHLILPTFKDDYFIGMLQGMGLVLTVTPFIKAARTKFIFKKKA